MQMIVLYVECMLGLENDEIGEFLGSTLLAKLVDLLTDLDVSSSPVSFLMRLCLQINL